MYFLHISQIYFTVDKEPIKRSHVVNISVEEVDPPFSLSSSLEVIPKSIAKEQAMRLELLLQQKKVHKIYFGGEPYKRIKRRRGGHGHLKQKFSGYITNVTVKGFGKFPFDESKVEGNVRTFQCPTTVDDNSIINIL